MYNRTDSAREIAIPYGAFARVALSFLLTCLPAALTLHLSKRIRGGMGLTGLLQPRTAACDRSVLVTRRQRGPASSGDREVERPVRLPQLANRATFVV